jgi:hypothetical protein
VLRAVMRIQSIYYVITGLWPLLSLRSFELVTGPKTDDWLVHMVGLLAAVIGIVLWVGARPMRPAGAVVLLAALSAASFAAIDLRYALPGQISAIYLADAVAEIALLLLLAEGWRRMRRSS